jgi:hypothetical protein
MPGGVPQIVLQFVLFGYFVANGLHTDLISEVFLTLGVTASLSIRAVLTRVV